MFRFARSTAIVLAACVTTALAGCGSSGSSAGSSDTLVVQSWGGDLGAAEKAAFYDPFTKQTGIRLQLTFGSSGTANEASTSAAAADASPALTALSRERVRVAIPQA